MHPDKVLRSRLRHLTDLPNIGKAGAEDLRRLGLTTPAELAGHCPIEMYHRLCSLTGVRHDPCVLDVFISITEFMRGEPARPWWHYSPQREQWLTAAGSGQGASSSSLPR